MLRLITAWTLVVLGVLLGAGGTWLAVLGGSWAYGVAGLALAACGVLLVRRRRAALSLYAAVLVAAAVWSLWEVRLDRWALVPRGALLAVIGLWLLAPWIDRSLGEAGAVQVPARSSWRGPRGWLAAAMLMVVAIAATSITRDPFDVAGSLPDAPVAAVAAVVVPDPAWMRLALPSQAHVWFGWLPGRWAA